MIIEQLTYFHKEFEWKMKTNQKCDSALFNFVGNIVCVITKYQSVSLCSYCKLYKFESWMSLKVSYENNNFYNVDAKEKF